MLSRTDKYLPRKVEPIVINLPARLGDRYYALQNSLARYQALSTDKWLKHHTTPCDRHILGMPRDPSTKTEPRKCLLL